MYHQAEQSKVLHGNHIACMYFVWISEQTETYALYTINRLVIISRVQSVYCVVQTESLYKTDTVRLERVMMSFFF
jgi:hypothetical protein